MMWWCDDDHVSYPSCLLSLNLDRVIMAFVMALKVMMRWCDDVMMWWCDDVMWWCDDMMWWCDDVMMCWCDDVLTGNAGDSDGIESDDVMMWWCDDVMMCWQAMLAIVMAISPYTYQQHLYTGLNTAQIDWEWPGVCVCECACVCVCARAGARACGFLVPYMSNASCLLTLICPMHHVS